MELGATLRLLRRWWPTLLIATWVAAVTGFLVASALPPRYEAETQVLVGPATGDIDTLRAASMLVQTYSQLAASDEVLAPALKAAGAAVTPDAARDYLRTSGDDVTRVVTIRYEDADPRLAAGVVSKIAEQLAAFGGGDTSRPEGQVTVLVNAQVPQQSVAPRTALLVVLAALMGLLGAVALALIFDRLFPTVRGEDDVPGLVGAPSLASIPSIRLDRDEPPVVGELLRPSAAQMAYRQLASRVRLDSASPGLLHVAGVDASGGAGEVAANIAAVLASAGQRVAVVDADPDRVAATLLARDPNIVLEDDSDEIVRVETRLGIPLFRAAGPGQITIPGETVDEIVEKQHGNGTPVILVGPPIGSTAVAVQWARQATETLIVIRQDATRRRDLSVAGESLGYVGARVVGAAVVASGRSLPGMKRLSQWRKSPPPSPDAPTGWSAYGVAPASAEGDSTTPSTVRSSTVATDDAAEPPAVPAETSAARRRARRSRREAADRLTEPSS